METNKAEVGFCIELTCPYCGRRTNAWYPTVAALKHSEYNDNIYDCEWCLKEYWFKAFIKVDIITIKQ